MTPSVLTLAALMLTSPALALDFADDDNDGYTSDVDCDDSDPEVHPDADEVCDHKDNDCDGLVDSDDDDYMPPAGIEECTGVPPQDNDGDGVFTPDDCDDTDPSIYPGHPELCDDVDHDCDGESVPDIDSSGPAYRDIDGDGYGDLSTKLVICGEPPDGWVWNSEDCDDVNAEAYPGATEVCDDGIDQDCDSVDEPCPDPDYDQDGDGHETPEDCNDADTTVYPGAIETCSDGVDQDCDGVDELCPEDDADGDGYEAPEDCDDANAAIYPGADEVCDDDIDQDCDGVDEPCPDPIDSGDTSQTFPDDEGGGAGCVGSGTGSMYASLFLPLLLLRRRRRD